MPCVSVGVGVGVGVGDAVGDDDAVGASVGAADLEDVPDADAEACGVTGPGPGLTVTAGVTEGVGWPWAGGA
jgi:hypothetical protein